MQYLLSEEEMAAVNSERQAARKMPHLEALTNFVKHAACTMVETDASGAPTGRPHGCIHVRDLRGTQHDTRYCDFCALAGICPLPKEWSK